MTMRKYTVRSVHKISNPCKCGCRSHSEGSGRCTAWNTTTRAPCECEAFDPTDVAERELPGEVMDAPSPDLKAVARALREARILQSGGRLSHVERKGAKLTCFPTAGTWQSFIISLAPSELTASVAIRDEAARVGWPTSFATDLAHDYRAIGAMMPREPFTWCLRADGTHIGRVAALGERGTSLKMHMVAHAFGDDVCRFYLWDGAALRPVDAAKTADAFLAKLAGERFTVRTRRSSSLVPHSAATREVADKLAAEWEERFGEPWIVVDTWEAR